MHANLFADQEAGRHQRRYGADNHQQIGYGKGVDQLLPRRDRHADGKQNRIGHRRAEELIYHLRALLQTRRDAVYQLKQHREKQHAHRRGQADGLLAKHTQHIEQHRQQRAGGQRRHVHFALGGRFAVRLVAAVRHQLPLAGQMRETLAQLV